MNQGKILRNYVKGTGLIVEEFAERLGISRSKLYEYFRMKTIEDEDFIQNVRNVFKYNIGDPVSLEENMASNEEIMTLIDVKRSVSKHKDQILDIWTEIRLLQSRVKSLEDDRKPTSKTGS